MRNFESLLQQSNRYLGKNNFIEVFKNLDTNLKIILLAHQNNYVECSSYDIMPKFFATLFIILKFPI